MKKIILLGTMMIFLMLITSCTYLPSDLPEKITSPFTKEKGMLGEETEYQTGTEGLKINFLKEARHQKIREGSLFDISFELQNKGNSNINEGLYRLITEDPYVTIERNYGAFILQGKNQYMPQGETKRITFSAKAGKILQQQVYEYPTKATLVACYAYETISSKPVCVDTDIEGIKKDKPCRVEELNLAEGQGAPLVITKIIPAMQFSIEGPIPAFEIYVENQGEGQITAPEYIGAACGPKAREKNTDYDLIEVEAYLSNKKLKCTPQKINVKKGKEKIVMCEQTTALTRMDTYTAPLQVILKYGYLTSTYGDLIITKGIKP